jgi:hypothetical protein
MDRDMVVQVLSCPVNVRVNPDSVRVPPDLGYPGHSLPPLHSAGGIPSNIFKNR